MGEINLKDFEGKFFGLNFIEKAELSENKTYLGKDKVKLTYDNKKIEEYPLEVIDKVISSTAIDLTDLRLRRLTPIAEKILILLTESELKKEDMEYLVTALIPGSINQALNRAYKKVFFNKEPHEITLMDVERVLKEKE